MPTQLESLEERLPPLLKKYGPDNPHVKGLQAQLDAERRHSKGLLPSQDQTRNDPQPAEMDRFFIMTHPTGFAPVEITVKLDSIKDHNRSMEHVRYHPDFGLVQGWIDIFSYYDRGAGGFMSGRGRRVKWFIPTVDLFLKNVNLRKCKGLQKQSVWRVTGSPPVIVGRDRMTKAIRTYASSSNSKCAKFENKADAERYLVGSIESTFLQTTLPVSIEESDHEYRLKFFGKLLSANGGILHASDDIYLHINAPSWLKNNPSLLKQWASGELTDEQVVENYLSLSRDVGAAVQQNPNDMLATINGVSSQSGGLVDG